MPAILLIALLTLLAAGTAAAEPVPDAAPAAVTERDAAQQTFLRLMDEKRYEEAATISAQVVDLTRRLHGDGSLELAVPLTNLGTAQMERGDLAGAESSYAAAIDIIERRDGIASPRLVNPLVGLGETCNRGGLYPQATAAFERALQANHAAAGFYNLGQVKILDGLSESYLGINKLEQANAQQQVQVTIQRRHAPGDPDAQVKALEKLGRWYNRTGQYPESQVAFQQARALIRSSGRDDAPAVVDTLLGEAVALENQGAIPNSTTMLKRALDVVDAQPQVDHRQRAEVLVAMGDLYIVAGQPRSARQRYAQAWQELSGDEALQAERDGYFAQPRRIGGPPRPDLVDESGRARSPTGRGSGAYADGVVVAGLTVSIDGSAEDTHIIESTPPGLLDRQVLRVLDASMFRPAMENGEQVARASVQFRHDFRYPKPAPRRDDEAPLPAPAAGEKGGPIAYPGSK